VLHRLQAVLNASARTITGLPHSAHNTTSLTGLHRLRAAERINFRLATLTYRVCAVQPPANCLLSKLVLLTFLLVGAFTHPSPTLYLSARRGSSLSVIRRFRSLLLNCGINVLPGDVTAFVSLDCFSSSAENFVSRILSGFIICTARRFAIAVFALTLIIPTPTEFV